MDKTLEDYVEETIYKRMCSGCVRESVCHNGCEEHEQAKEDMISEYHR